jgi:mannosyltransferase OCH1-like enzyme
MSDNTHTKGGIPKIIHQIWIGDNMPPVIKLYTSTFKNISGYKYILWGNEHLKKENFLLTWKYISKLLKKRRLYGRK